MSYAPSYKLDIPSYLSIEYPLRVKDTSKAIKMVGGSTKISQCFIDPEMKLQLKLRPGDPYSHPVNSSKITSDENVLFKLRIPKRIMDKHTGDVQSALEECEKEGKKYYAEAVGMISKTYRFRALADFQMIMKRSPFMQQFESSLYSGDLDQIKHLSASIQQDFAQKQTYTNTNMDFPPLVRYARADVPFNYRYSGNLLLDERGEWQNKAVKLHTIFVHWGEKPPRTFDPLLQEEYDKAVRDYTTLKDTVPERLANESPVFYFLECMKLLRKLFDMKPVWLRRHIYWMLPEKFRTQLRYALPYVAYTTTKGPWRQSFIKFGYDPSKNSKAALFQVEAFRSNRSHVSDSNVKRMLDKKEDVFIIPETLYQYLDDFSNPKSELNGMNIGKVPRQFFFDGENPTSAVSFQIGDIMDKDVKQIIRSAKIEQTCHEGSGWFDWVTICQLRAVIKYKMRCINEGKPILETRVVELSQRTQFSKNQYVHIRSDSDNEDDRDAYGEEGEDGDENENEDEEVDENGNGNEDGDEDENENENEEEESTNTKGKTNQDGKKCQVKDEDLLTRLEKYNPKSRHVIEGLEALIKQEDLESN